MAIGQNCVSAYASILDLCAFACIRISPPESV